MIYTLGMDWWQKKCEHCGQVFSKGWGHPCLNADGKPTFRDGWGELRPDLDPIRGSAGQG